MYYIVYDGKEANPNDQQQDQTRWKDDMKQYFKEYQSQDFTCSCGKVLRLGSKANHLRSLKHRLYVLEKLSKSTVEPLPY
jgi:hypothetical protein